MTKDEAARVIALSIIAAATQDFADWEDYPRIGEHDWQSVLDHIASIVGSVQPTHRQVTEAYEVLAQAKAVVTESLGGAL